MSSFLHSLDQAVLRRPFINYAIALLDTKGGNAPFENGALRQQRRFTGLASEFSDWRMWGNCFSRRRSEKTSATSSSLTDRFSGT